MKSSATRTCRKNSATGPRDDCTPLYEKFLAAAKKHGCAIELNTAGLRKDCREIYPSREILQLAFQKGVPITFGSDAHAPGEVGMNFAEAVQLARGVGYTESCRFVQRQRKQSGRSFDTPCSRPTDQEPDSAPSICLVLALVTLAVVSADARITASSITMTTDYITDNPHVKAGLTWPGIVWAFQSGYAANWHPLTWISHMLDCQLYGLNPAGHHLTNLLFHMANTLLLFLLLNGPPARCGAARSWRRCSPGIRCTWNRWRGWRNARTC